MNDFKKDYGNKFDSEKVETPQADLQTEGSEGVDLTETTEEIQNETVITDQIKPEESEEKVDTPANEFRPNRMVTNCDHLNLRELPSLEADVICVLVKFDKLYVAEDGEDWTNVLTDDGKEGYVMSKFITTL